MTYKLKAKRVEKGIKQGDLAKKVGVSRATLNSIENNRTQPKKNLMLKIAEELGCSVGELFFS